MKKTKTKCPVLEHFGLEEKFIIVVEGHIGFEKQLKLTNFARKLGLNRMRGSKEGLVYFNDPKK